MIGRPPSRTWRLSTAIPSYMKRVQAQNQPDCATYNQPNSDPNSFSLPPNGYCYFAFQVDGTQFTASNLKQADYRPMFINSGGVIYGPCESQIIHITLSTLPPAPPAPLALIGAGSYEDSSHLTRPLLVASQDIGNTWNYPDVITNPVFTANPFGNDGILLGSSCNSNTCIAVGSYCTGNDCGVNYKTTIDRKYLPLIAVSTSLLPKSLQFIHPSVIQPKSQHYIFKQPK